MLAGFAQVIVGVARLIVSVAVPPPVYPLLPAALTTVTATA